MDMKQGYIDTGKSFPVGMPANRPSPHSCKRAGATNKRGIIYQMKRALNSFEDYWMY